MQKTLLSGFVLAAALFSACEDSVAPVTSTAGRWQGRVDQLDVVVDIREDDRQGIIAGTGQWGVPGDIDRMTVQGMRRGNTVNFVIFTPGYENATFTGQFAILNGPARLSGQLNGSGFENHTLVLTRQ